MQPIDKVGHFDLDRKFESLSVLERYEFVRELASTQEIHKRFQEVNALSGDLRRVISKQVHNFHCVAQATLFAGCNTERHIVKRVRRWEKTTLPLVKRYFDRMTSAGAAVADSEFVEEFQEHIKAGFHAYNDADPTYDGSSDLKWAFTEFGKQLDDYFVERFQIKTDQALEDAYDFDYSNVMVEADDALDPTSEYFRHRTLAFARFQVEELYPFPAAERRNELFVVKNVDENTTSLVDYNGFVAATRRMRDLYFEKFAVPRMSARVLQTDIFTQIFQKIRHERATTPAIKLAVFQPQNIDYDLFYRLYTKRRLVDEYQRFHKLRETLRRCDPALAKTVEKWTKRFMRHYAQMQTTDFLVGASIRARPDSSKRWTFLLIMVLNVAFCWFFAMFVAGRYEVPVAGFTAANVSVPAPVDAIEMLNSTAIHTDEQLVQALLYKSLLEQNGPAVRSYLEYQPIRLFIRHFGDKLPAISEIQSRLETDQDLLRTNTQYWLLKQLSYIRPGKDPIAALVSNGILVQREMAVEADAANLLKDVPPEILFDRSIVKRLEGGNYEVTGGARPSLIYDAYRGMVIDGRLSQFTDQMLTSLKYYAAHDDAILRAQQDYTDTKKIVWSAIGQQPGLASFAVATRGMPEHSVVAFFLHMATTNNTVIQTQLNHWLRRPHAEMEDNMQRRVFKVSTDMLDPTSYQDFMEELREEGAFPSDYARARSEFENDEMPYLFSNWVNALVLDLSSAQLSTTHPFTYAILPDGAEYIISRTPTVVVFTVSLTISTFITTTILNYCVPGLRGARGPAGEQRSQRAAWFSRLILRASISMVGMIGLMQIMGVAQAAVIGNPDFVAYQRWLQSVDVSGQSPPNSLVRFLYGLMSTSLGWPLRAIANGLNNLIYVLAAQGSYLAGFDYEFSTKLGISPTDMSPFFRFVAAAKSLYNTAGTSVPNILTNIVEKTETGMKAADFLFSISFTEILVAYLVFRYGVPALYNQGRRIDPMGSFSILRYGLDFTANLAGKTATAIQWLGLAIIVSNVYYSQPLFALPDLSIGHAGFIAETFRSGEIPDQLWGTGWSPAYTQLRFEDLQPHLLRMDEMTALSRQATEFFSSNPALLVGVQQIIQNTMP